MPGGRAAGEQAARRAQLDQAAATHGRAFEDACRQLEQDFYALEDDLRDRLYAFSEATEPA